MWCLETYLCEGFPLREQVEESCDDLLAFPRVNLSVVEDTRFLKHGSFLDTMKRRVLP